MAADIEQADDAAVAPSHTAEDPDKTMPVHARTLRRTRLLVFAIAVATAPAALAADADREESERLIRAERPIIRDVLAAPYTVFSLTGWPLKWAVNWMENTAVPDRVVDVFLFPVDLFDGEEDGEE